MTLKLLEMSEADKLSACKLSLLLGVNSSDNKIERYMRVARGILNLKKAIFSFHDEPYAWYTESLYDFRMLVIEKNKSLLPYFEQDLMITAKHHNYQEFSQHLRGLNIPHQRVVGLNFKYSETGESFGQVIFFDDAEEDITVEQMSLLDELSSGLVTILEKRTESENYLELYEQECALNFSKTKFFQIIAHDLRAPFHGLIGFSEVLAKEQDTLDRESIQNIAEYLYDTAMSTYTLLENLLNWAMAEGGRFVYHPINFNLKQSTKIVYDVLNMLAIKKNIQLVDEVPEHLKVYADINMVTSIIQNLVSNALKFTHVDGSGKVIISAKESLEGIEISIRDTGIGMTEQQMQNIFEPEINASFKGTSGERGTGLGLVLCKRFVDLNHGVISVSSKMGEGTVFTLILPTAKHSHQALVTASVDKKTCQKNNV